MSFESTAMLYLRVYEKIDAVRFPVFVKLSTSQKNASTSKGGECRPDDVKP